MPSRQPSDTFHSINLSGGKWDWAIVAGENRQELQQARLECKRTWEAACRALIESGSGSSPKNQLALTRRFNWPTGISNNQVVRIAVGGKLAGKCEVRLDGKVLEVTVGNESKMLLSAPISKNLSGQCFLEIFLDPDICNSEKGRNPVSGAWIRIEP